MPKGLHLKDINLESEDIPASDSPLESATSTPLDPHHDSSTSMPSGHLLTVATLPELATLSTKRNAKFDPQKKIIQVSIGGPDNELLPSNECSQRCTHFFYQRNDAEGVCWQKVTDITKEVYWTAFKATVTYPEYTDEEIYKAWKTKAAERYADWISALSKLKTKPKPKQIGQENWDAWTKYWDTEEFKVKSRRGSKNRDRNGKGKVNHTGGSQKFAVHLSRFREKGYDPDPAEFHKRTHTRKNQPEVFCDDYASQVHKEYLASAEETLSQLQSQAISSGSSEPVTLSKQDKAELYKKVAGGEKKGRVYGAGSAMSDFYSVKRRKLTSFGLRSDATLVNEMKGQIQHLEDTMAKLKEEQEREREEERNKRKEDRKRAKEKMKKMEERMMEKLMARMSQ